MFSDDQTECIRCYFDAVPVAGPLILNGTAEVYFAETSGLADFYQGLKQYLGKDELDRADRFVHEKDRITYISCHAVLRLILAKKLTAQPREILFHNGIYNKPKLQGDPIFFNITHTGNAFAIVIADDYEAGIDMESINRELNLDGIIKNFFSNREGSYIWQEKVEASARFFKLWTRKEALLKALGTGIADNLPGVEVSEKENYIRKESFENLVPASVLREHYIYSFMYQDYFLSIATPSKTSFNFVHLNGSSISSFFE